MYTAAGRDPRAGRRFPGAATEVGGSEVTDRNDQAGSGPMTRLVPFATGPGGPGPLVEAGCTLAGSRLELVFVIHDPTGEVRIPPREAVPARREGLWRTTCLEAFLAGEADGSYWELNLSPSGHWNLERFAAYRQPAGEACPLEEADTRWTAGEGVFVMHCRLPLERLGLASHPLVVGVCAVIESRSGEMAYYALGHPGPRPDFHRREGWLLRLSGPTPQDEAEL